MSTTAKREPKLQIARSGWVRLRSKDKRVREIKDPLLPNGVMLVEPGAEFSLPTVTYSRHLNQLAWAENLDVTDTPARKKLMKDAEAKRKADAAAAKEREAAETIAAAHETAAKAVEAADAAAVVADAAAETAKVTAARAAEAAEVAAEATGMAGKVAASKAKEAKGRAKAAQAEASETPPEAPKPRKGRKRNAK